MRVLGVNAVFYDPAAAVVVDGRLVAAAEEEHFTLCASRAGLFLRTVLPGLDPGRARRASSVLADLAAGPVVVVHPACDCFCEQKVV